MDAMPTDLVKLCHLASLAECGDHFWEAVPSLGVWTAVLMPVTKRWAEWRSAERDTLGTAPKGNLGS